jgi:heme exporter protein C
MSVSGLAISTQPQGAAASPSAGKGPRHAGPRWGSVFVVSAIVGLGLVLLGLYLSFFVAPVEATMGLVQKIFYFHVPVAWLTFLAVVIGAAASVVHVVNKSEDADALAQASLELGALFGLMVLVTGPLWGYKAWGTAWEWDVRLTTFLVLELVLLAYVLLRAYAGRGARALASGIAIFGVVQIPLVYFSVDLWRGQHPPRVVSEGGLHPDMLTALIVCNFGFMLLFVALLGARLTLARVEAEVDALHLLAAEKGLEDR